MRPNRHYLPNDGQYPFTGLNVRDPATMINPGMSPYLLNVQATRGVVKKRTGYRKLIDDKGGATLDQTIMLLTHFETALGVRKLVCVTLDDQFLYDFASTQWTDITKLDVEEEPVPWTGDETNFVDCCSITDSTGKYLIITNGVDPPQKWDGDDPTFTDLDLSDGTITLFKTCEVFYNRLFVANVTVDGATYKQSIAWSKAGAITDWSDATAGSVLISDSKGDIEKLLTLADRLVIYSTDSIGVCVYVGGASQFSFEQLVKETKLVSPRTIVPVGPYHFFMSQDNVFIFDGTRLIRPVGDLVSEDFRQHLNHDRLYEAHAYHDFVKRQVHWTIPFDETAHRTYVMEYDINNPMDVLWNVFEYSDRPTAVGFFYRDADFTCDCDLLAGVECDDVFFRCDAAGLRAEFPIKVMGDAASEVFMCDETAVLDDATSVTATFDTKDFTTEQSYRSTKTRWIELEVEMRGSAVTVSYSKDQGQNFTEIKTKTLTSQWTKYRLFFDAISETIRFRFSSTSHFELKWLRVWHNPREGDQE